MTMDGILPLYKDRGMTSHDAVFKCRKIFKTRKVGHSGTLDPNVDGVLPICIGKATKVVNYLMESGKIYHGEITLGFATETEDLDGAVVASQPLSQALSDQEIQAAMETLVGDIIQIPPMYSAVKVNGRRLYDYARNGESVDRPKRQIHVDYFKMQGKSTFDPETGYQKFRFEVGCGKGTYVRTLAVDLGQKLGLPAVMSDLTRLKSGGFVIGQAVSLAQLAEMDEAQLEATLFAPEHAFHDVPQVNLTDSQWQIIKNGGFLPGDLGLASAQALLFYEQKLRAVYKYDKVRNCFKPEQMIDLT
ncbi:tRNA pseudouridine synthase B [Ligilactobacillus equi DPC 6820]|uniref:tRNA pseudouridine synthase B n=2 Tax=Ligilactobacillus equi TaxID=137357 RepID=V7HT32_9LACO|nr:tRNA pseudouridine synthase B [Ligilactobacillus equi DPC 6820]